jgi:hypothetical protein
VIARYIHLGLQFFGGIFLSKIRVKSSMEYKILGREGHHYFVGYYDIDPVDKLGKNILCHRISTKYTRFVEPEVGEVGLMSIGENKFTPIANTHALNWQLGSRVQWLSDGEIIFNDIEDGTQCSKIIDIHTGEMIRKFIRPFWAVSPNKKIAASLNFSRISKKRPGYGYSGTSVDKDNEVFTIFSLEDGKEIFKISLDEIFKQINFDIPDGVDPYFNHIEFSLCSQKLLIIFHFIENGKAQKNNYPLVFNTANNNLELIHTAGGFSHYAWFGNQSILAYLKLHNKWCFAKWNNSSWLPIKNSMPEKDGHISFLMNNKHVVVDGYPDRIGRMPLYIGSIESGKKLETILRIMNPISYRGALRCDLHPRVSCSDSYVICDMPTKLGRRLLSISINKITERIDS